MDQKFLLTQENPKNRSNLLSSLCFAWMGDICYRSITDNLKLKDIYKNQETDDSILLTDKLQCLWEEDIAKAKLGNHSPSLLRVLIRTHWKDYIWQGALIFVNVVILKSVQPLILGSLLRCFTENGYNIEGITYNSIFLSSVILISTFFVHHSNCGAFLLGMRMRIATSALVYRKILRLSENSLSKNAAGEIVNLLSNDVARFDSAVLLSNYLWISPIHVVVVTYLMWSQIGSSTFIGITFTLLLTVPFQVFLAYASAKYRMEVARKAGNRVHIIDEILAGIQIIKMFNWEEPFEHMVQNARKEEIGYLIRTSRIRAILSSFMCFISRATLAVTIIYFIIMGQEIRADVVFPISSFLSMLQFTIAMVLPVAISTGAECLVSITRIEDFLLMEEKQTSKMISSENNEIFLEHVNASTNFGNAILKDFSIRIPPGSLCAIVGPIGSNKSSFLKLLLGELVVSSGSIKIPKNVSYTSQTPWVFQATIRDNILFNEAYDECRYGTILEICGLKRDLNQLPNSDRTLVGDKGVSLSEGQRTRINLARAVYKESDIYLLDDPLSALDTKSSKHIFSRCILDYLKEKTRILVTYNLQNLMVADLVIVLGKEGVEAYGTLDELMRSNHDFSRMFMNAEEISNTQTLQPEKERMDTMTQILPNFSGNTKTVEKQNQIEEEVVNFRGSPFQNYLKQANNMTSIITVFVLFIFCQIVLSAVDYWITLWTDEAEKRQITRINSTTLYEDGLDTKSWLINVEVLFQSGYENFKDLYTETMVVDGIQTTQLKLSFVMYFYIFLIITMIIITLARTLLFFSACMNISKNMHDEIFHCVLDLPMRFFNNNLIGRILNRFSKDMGSIDDLLPKALIDVIQNLLLLVGTIIMVVIPNPYIIFVLIPMALFFLQVKKWFFVTVRTLKMIETAAKSPVFSHIASTLDGLITIRSTKNHDVISEQFDEFQNIHTSAWCLTIYCSEAFGLWMDLICAVFVMCVIGGIVLLNHYLLIGGSFAGLAITQSMSLIGMLQYCVLQAAQVVTHLTSVERVLEYTQLDKEQYLETVNDNIVPVPWPSKGEIQLNNVYLRYNLGNQPVLKNLNIHIKPSEKIGIVGRTGAGKSSLISALFRLAVLEGKIFIDGLDTENIDVKYLRKNLTVIPQHHELFSASVRYNLDPLGIFSDGQLWDVLKEVKMKNEIVNLDHQIIDGGKNLSVGQRQLICLARSFLKNNKIVILDEATANVDSETDDFIQKIIRRKFAHCTVLTIAHRLNTIIDYDKILVIDDGRVVEFDHPYILLQNPKGFFTMFLEEMGPTMTEKLRLLTKEFYDLGHQ